MQSLQCDMQDHSSQSREYLKNCSTSHCTVYVCYIYVNILWSDPVLLHIVPHCSVCNSYLNILWSNHSDPVCYTALFCVLHLFKYSLV